MLMLEWAAELIVCIILFQTPVMNRGFAFSRQIRRRQHLKVLLTQRPQARSQTEDPTEGLLNLMRERETSRLICCAGGF